MLIVSTRRIYIFYESLFLFNPGLDLHTSPLTILPWIAERMRQWPYIVGSLKNSKPLSGRRATAEQFCWGNTNTSCYKSRKNNSNFSLCLCTGETHTKAKVKSLSLSLSKYIYIYICVCVCVSEHLCLHTHTYIGYIYIYEDH